MCAAYRIERKSRWCWGGNSTTVAAPGSAARLHDFDNWRNTFLPVSLQFVIAVNTKGPVLAPTSGVDRAW